MFNYSTALSFPSSDSSDVSYKSEAHLEYTGTIRRSPCIEQIVFASSDEPLASVGKLKRENTRVMEVQLVLLRPVDVDHLNIATLHTNVSEKEVRGRGR